MVRRIQLSIITLGIALVWFNRINAQEYKTLEIRNCQHEMRTITFQHQVDFFWKWAYGMGGADIAKQRILNFSPSYTVDSSFLRSQIAKIRKSVPPGFFNIHLTGDWFDDTSDESAIWFTVVLAKVGRSGDITPYAAYRVTFDGNNAHIDQQRMNPRIKNIEFIFDKPGLAKLSAQLKTLPRSDD